MLESCHQWWFSKGKLPSGVIVHNNEKGWMYNDIMNLWLNRPGGFFCQQKSLLVLDSMRVHISDISQTWFSSALKRNSAFFFFRVLPLRFLFYSIFNTSDFADFRFFVVLVKSGLISKERIQATDSIPTVIPGGLTKLLQPLDISVNETFKAELRKLWESWM